MKKIIFLAMFADLEKSSGIIRKIYDQSKYWKDLGLLYSTYILYPESKKDQEKLYENKDYIKFVPVNYFGDLTTRKSKFSFYKSIFNKYIEIAKEEKNNYNYIYIRFHPLFPWFIKFLYKFRGKIIVEHNSREIPEYIANGRNKMAFISRLFEKIVRRYVKGYITVCNDVAKYQKKMYSQNKKVKGLMLPNGIDVGAYEKRTPIKYDGKNINMIFVGNIRYWHGLDRVCYGLANYKGNKNVTFTVIGPFNQIDDISGIIKEKKLEKKVLMLGYKSKTEMNKYFDKAHIAVGCLGLFRKGSNDGSTLKNREYFSRGIPIVSAEIDEDVSKNCLDKYYFMVSNDATPVDIDRVVRIVEKTYLDSEDGYCNEIREYAEKNMSYKVKAKKFKKFVDSLED